MHATFRTSSLALIAMNLTLIVPVSLMAGLEKPIEFGLWPAIFLAAYTFYRLVLACRNFLLRKQSANLLTRELRTINLMDTLLAIITVQNALVSVKSTASVPHRIMAPIAVSSAFLLFAIIAISVRNYVLGMRELRKP